ncbi:cytochrome P450 [Hymenopellis radicata]|nr:cytochrome P450 [Hymenopellis radicata]
MYRLTDWAARYGSIYSLKLGSGTVIVLSSATAVKELLDQQSWATADRPASYLTDLVTDGMHLALRNYDDLGRALRKGAQAVLTPQASARHFPIQHAEATQLMYDFMKQPEAFFNHIRRYTDSVISSVVLGKRSPSYESEHTVLFYEFRTPVDMVPILKYLPEFLAPWKKESRELRRMQHKLHYTALRECEERLERGEGNDCYLEELIRQQDELALSRDQIAWIPGGCSRRGWNQHDCEFFALPCFGFGQLPRTQRKAQEEIDRVVGHDRAPTLADYDSLPYTRAFIQEVHRTRPVAPLTVPHRATVAQKYQGYVIPKGAVIFLNVYAFDEPEAFIPERYLKSRHGTKEGFDDANFRNNFGFGSGRRICPGQILANNSLAIIMMNLIWAFDFAPANKDAGNPYDIKNFVTGLTCTARPFECNITLRSEAKEKIIEQQFIDAIRVFENFESTLGPADKEYIRRTRTTGHGQ